MAFPSLVAAADRAVQGHLGGVPVTYQPQYGPPVEVTGTFDNPFTLVKPGELAVGMTGPAVFLRLEDLPVHPDDDNPLLTIAGIVYRVRERHADGMGGIYLLLHVDVDSEVC